jgi:hypothetical protein
MKLWLKMYLHDLTAQNRPISLSRCLMEPYSESSQRVQSSEGFISVSSKSQFVSLEVLMYVPNSLYIFRRRFLLPFERQERATYACKMIEPFPRCKNASPKSSAILVCVPSNRGSVANARAWASVYIVERRWWVSAIMRSMSSSHKLKPSRTDTSSFLHLMATTMQRLLRMLPHHLPDRSNTMQLSWKVLPLRPRASNMLGLSPAFLDFHTYWCQGQSSRSLQTEPHMLPWPQLLAELNSRLFPIKTWWIGSENMFSCTFWCKVCQITEEADAMTWVSSPWKNFFQC